MASVYEKLAKAGWLGTKAQVSQQYGNPSWSTKDDSQPDDTMAKALKKQMNKQTSTQDPDTSGS